MKPTTAPAYQEDALNFRSGQTDLVGILARPATMPPADTAVLIIVGGPQYRVGSHRQFTLLARALASRGWPVLRFDYRGMGDSSGDELPHFERCQDDIAAAIAQLFAQLPGLRRVVPWGLCDGASAALLHWQQQPDARVAGLCLVNPWLRSAEGLARTQVKHYYTRRLMEADFWRKLLRGGVGLGALRDLLRAVRTALGWQPARADADGKAPSAPAAQSAPRPDFRQRMAEAASTFNGPVLLLISGDDYTAKEFLDGAAQDARWQTLMRASRCQRADLPAADHTLSDPADEAELHRITLAWLARHWRPAAGS